jgi:hypothetical protein
VPILDLRRCSEISVDLRNNILCNSLGLPWFAGKCAQNVPTGAARSARSCSLSRRSAPAIEYRLDLVKIEPVAGRRIARIQLARAASTRRYVPKASARGSRTLARSKSCECALASARRV